MRTLTAIFFVAILVGWSHLAWSQQQHSHSAAVAESINPSQPKQAPGPVPTPASPSPPAAAMAHGDMHAPTIFTLRSGIAQGRMVYIGVGGDIDGKVNPTLSVHEGETVQINLINGEGAQHDIVVDQYAARTNLVLGRGASSTLSFTADKAGEFIYFCSVPGHREAGHGRAHPSSAGAKGRVAAIAPDIVRDPTDLPLPLHARPPQVVRVDLETVELKGQLDDKTTYDFWTFNGKVPGPFVRVRVGDTVEVHLKNDENSVMTHSVDFHAATGPGGGAEFTQTDPGEEKIVTFKALDARPVRLSLRDAKRAAPHHQWHVRDDPREPEGGLPQVDREFYVMQGELYTAKPFRDARAIRRWIMKSSSPSGRNIFSSTVQWVP